MKSFTIKWDRIKDGSFPMEEISKIKNMDVVFTATGVLTGEVTFFTTNNEDFDLSLAFQIGHLVASYQYIPTT